MLIPRFKRPPHHGRGAMLSPGQLEDLLDAVELLGNLSVAPPLQLQASQGGIAISLGKTIGPPVRRVILQAAVSGQPGWYTAITFGDPIDSVPGALTTESLGPLAGGVNCIFWNLAEVAGVSTALPLDLTDTSQIVHQGTQVGFDQTSGWPIIVGRAQPHVIRLVQFGAASSNAGEYQGNIMDRNAAFGLGMPNDSNWGPGGGACIIANLPDAGLSTWPVASGTYARGWQAGFAPDGTPVFYTEVYAAGSGS